VFFRVDPKAIYCFAKVAEFSSFTRAARELNLAQPNLSAIVRRLEDRLGVDLFIRRTNPITLTDAGRRLLETATGLVAALETMQATVCGMIDESRLFLRVGGISSSVPIDARQRLIGEFVEAHPQIGLSLVEVPVTGELVALEDGSVDVVFGFGDPPPSYHSMTLARRSLMLALPRSHPLAEKAFLSPHDMKGANLLDWPTNDDPVYRSIVRPFTKAAATLTTSPETSVKWNIRFARARQLIYPMIGFFAEGELIPDDMCLRPADPAMPQCGFYIAAKANTCVGAVGKFWATAEKIGMT
jgi:hypothetical protein